MTIEKEIENIQIPLEMYAVPRSEKHTSDLYEMYKKSEQRELDKIKQAVKRKSILKKINEKVQYTFELMTFRLDRFGTKSKMFLKEELIRSLSQKQKFKLAKIFFKSKDIENQKTAIFILYLLSKEEQKVECIKIGLEKGGDIIKQHCALKIRFLNDEKYKKELYFILKELILKALSSGYEQLSYIRLIEYLPEEQMVECIKIGLQSKDELVVKKCSEIVIFTMSKEKRDILFPLIPDKYDMKIIEPPLYTKIRRDLKGNYLLSKAKFEKDGSETTLLGGGLEGKVIVRHINPESFLAWRKAFEDYDMWRQEGFDYVPVEPIVKFRLNNDGLVDVYSGVLDHNLADFTTKNGPFFNELTEEADKIKEILLKNKIIHGHSHNWNFCLRFFDDENGNIDFSKKPRIYIIDFDQAYIQK